MGYTFLKESNVATSDTTFLYCKGETTNAIGYVSTNGFMVTKGSRVSDHVAASLEKHMKSYAMLRKQLETDGVIVDSEFQQDYEFRSPSAAACVVRGHSANGTEAWRTNDGKKLKDL